MAYINRMVGQDYIDKLREYLDYVEEHLENVRKAFCELSDICQGMWWVGDDINWHTLRMDVEWHDVSKLSQAELVPYADKFYPTKHEPMEWHDNFFDKAWEHHKKHNSHHHESLKNNIDVVHMIIDWTAMGYKFGDTAQQYYETNKDKISLTEKQKEVMYEIFERIEKHNAKRPTAIQQSLQPSEKTILSEFELAEDRLKEPSSYRVKAMPSAFICKCPACLFKTKVPDFLTLARNKGTVTCINCGAIMVIDQNM